MIQVNKIGTFSGHRDCVYALEKSPEPHRFFSAAGDGLVVRWDFQNPDQGEVVAQVGASVYALHYRPENQELWIGQNFDGLHVLDLTKKRENRSVQLTSAAIFDIRSHGNDIYVAAGDGTLIVLDREAFAVRKHVKASEKSARCLAVNPLTNELAVGYSDHAIRIFDLGDFRLKRVVEAHANSVFSLVYSLDYQLLISGSRDAHLKVWDVGNGYTLHKSVVAHMFAINHIAFRPDGRYFVTGSMDKSVKVWDAGTFQLLKVIDRARHAGHGTSVNKVLWSDYFRLGGGRFRLTFVVYRLSLEIRFGRCAAFERDCLTFSVLGKNCPKRRL
ncbi:MAG: WD40 repeat domain-containing protein [Cytophagales bacterium]|nr:WD40 repeat domain-containing protein [Cytophagales bacterium]